MRIRTAHKRAVQAIARRFVPKGAFGRKLKIMIRCGLLRDGFHWPILIFRKAKGFKALNPTTRICENRIFNQYFTKQTIAHYIILNRFYKQAAEFEKPGGPKFGAGRPFPFRFPLMSTGPCVYVDRIQYPNRVLERHENRDRAPKKTMPFGESQNIQDATSAEQSIIIPEKKSGKSADPARIMGRAETGQREPAQDRILRMVAECSIVRNISKAVRSPMPAQAVRMQMVRIAPQKEPIGDGPDRSRDILFSPHFEGRTEPAPGFPNPEVLLTVREAFLRKERSGFLVSGIPESRSAYTGNEPQSARESVEISEKSGSRERFPAQDRIFRMVAECSAAKNISESGQAGFLAGPAMLFPEGAGSRGPVRGRIERLFSGEAAGMTGAKAVRAPLPLQTGRMQTVGTVPKEDRPVSLKDASGKKPGILFSQRSATSRNALGNPDGVRPEFSRTMFEPGREGIHFPDKYRALQAQAGRTFKDSEARAMKSALKRPGPDRAGSRFSNAEDHHAEVSRAASQIQNKPTGSGAMYSNKNRDDAQSRSRARQTDAPRDEKYAAQETRYAFPLPAANAGDPAVSGTPMQVLKTTEQNKRFRTQIIAQSRRILNRMEQANRVNFGLQKETDRQENGIRRMRADVDPVSVFRGQIKAERLGASSTRSFSSRMPGEPGLAKESSLSRSLPEFAGFVHPKQGAGQAFSAGRRAASGPNGAALGARGPEFVLKKEGTPARQAPAVQPVKETAAATPTVQTLYDSDAKKNQNQEINVIADRVYRILEKRIAIERDRRGFA